MDPIVPRPNRRLDACRFDAFSYLSASCLYRGWSQVIPGTITLRAILRPSGSVTA